MLDNSYGSLIGWEQIMREIRRVTVDKNCENVDATAFNILFSLDKYFVAYIQEHPDEGVYDSQDHTGEGVYYQEGSANVGSELKENDKIPCVESVVTY